MQTASLDIKKQLMTNIDLDSIPFYNSTNSDSTLSIAYYDCGGIG